MLFLGQVWIITLVMVYLNKDDDTYDELNKSESEDDRDEYEI